MGTASTFLCAQWVLCMPSPHSPQQVGCFFSETGFLPSQTHSGSQCSKVTFRRPPPEFRDSRRAPFCLVSAVCGQHQGLHARWSGMLPPEPSPCRFMAREGSAWPDSQHCFVVTAEGHVFVWGYGILGKGPKLLETAIPEMIPPTLFGLTEFNPEVQVSQIRCGLSHFAALTSKLLAGQPGQNLFLLKLG